MRRTLLLLVLAALLPPLMAAAPASAQASDIIPDGWSGKFWDHFGNPLKGTVYAESWVDLDWPCFTARDIDQNCDVQRIRGHGLVKKEYKVSRVEIGLVRLGRYPAGTLVGDETNKNSGTLPQIEQTTAWYTATNLGCGTDFRAWTRTSFAVRWTDNWLSKLSLLGDPTVERFCQAAAASPVQRQQLRQQLVAQRPVGQIGPTSG